MLRRRGRLSLTATSPQRHITAVLVVGAGGAGLRAAIAARDAGVDCLVVSTRSVRDAHTVLAARGVNAAFGTMDPEDSRAVRPCAKAERSGMAAQAGSDEPEASGCSRRRGVVIRCAWCGRYASGARWYEPSIWRLLLQARKRRRLVSHGICPDCWQEIAPELPYPDSESRDG